MLIKLHRKLCFIIIILAIQVIYVPSVQAQIIQVPNCDINPQHIFCQSQCSFAPEMSWCESPEPERDPIIIVPGMLASFNSQVILLNQESADWDFFPYFGNIYRGLIERLKVAGFKEGEDLFIAHYDWRQSNAESAVEFLQPVIEQAKQASGADKVDIIAHSMGGLVVRQYIQGPNYQDDVDQLIMLGTPNLGSADAYVAWEGGILPERWNVFIRGYITMVEGSLLANNLSPMSRPTSFRTFFPFLRDLIPLRDFTTRDGQLVATSELTEQNLFLQQLDNTLSELTDRVNLKTIAGTDLGTLNEVNLSEDRSILDMIFSRWRDGHAEPDPPPADTTAGDKSVTLASAHIGTNNLTLNNVEHDRLPEAAQVEVLQALDIETSGPMLTYDLPDSILGTAILSPVDPVITGPNGEIISNSQNTFPEAEYVDDPTDPDGPKMLVIANPPDGDYELTVTGTDIGDYTIITSYADEDETEAVSYDGETAVGQINTYTFTIGDGTFIPNMSLLELTARLKETIKELHEDEEHEDHEDEDEDEHQDKHIKHHGKLLGAANKLHNTAKKYIKSLDKHGEDNKKTEKKKSKLLKSFEKFSEKLDKEISKDHLDAEAVEEIVRLRDDIALVLGL